MPVTIGEAIRRKVKEDSRTAIEISAQLGMVPGNLNKIYKKTSMESEVIARFCLVLDYDFFVHVNPFFEAEAELQIPVDENVRTTLAKLQKCKTELREVDLEAKYLRKEVEHLRDNLTTSEKYIKMLEERNAELTQGSSPSKQS
jgi:hypothetical protein